VSVAAPYNIEAWVTTPMHVRFLVEKLTMGLVSLSPLVSPCYCHSTSVPYLFSLTYCDITFTKDKWVKTGNLVKSNVWKSEALDRKVLCASRAHKEIQSYFILISFLFHLFPLFPVFDLN
jgi:hypothetical protein